MLFQVIPAVLHLARDDVSHEGLNVRARDRRVVTCPKASNKAKPWIIDDGRGSPREILWMGLSQAEFGQEVRVADSQDGLCKGTNLRRTQEGIRRGRRYERPLVPPL